MSAGNFLVQAQLLGVRVTVRGQKLHLSPIPGTALPHSFLLQATVLKPELLTILATASDQEHSFSGSQPASVLYDASSPELPPLWRSTFDVIAAGSLPGGLTSTEWEQILCSAREFLREWAAHAYMLGWTMEEVLGLHPYAPMVRRDCRGLAWSLGHGVTVISIDDTGADVITGQRHLQRWWRPRRSPAETVAQH